METRSGQASWRVLMSSICLRGRCGGVSVVMKAAISARISVSSAGSE